MNLCSHNHDEICFDSRDCPLCYEVGILTKTLENTIEELNQLKDDLKQMQIEKDLSE